MRLLAKGTPIWITSVPILSIVSLVIHFITGSTYSLVLAGILVIIMFPVLMFFRDPERKIGKGVVSPADGVVTRADLNRGWADVSIFMNVHNVHVNRFPWRGKVTMVEHIPGGFVPAFDKGSDNNERVKIGLKTENGEWMIVQIAGAVARRIVPYVSVGDVLSKGERFGMIRFGSRVDLRFKMPRGYILRVEAGEKVKAGSTSLAW